MAAEGPTLLQRDHKLLGEVRLVSDITVLVVHGQTQYIHAQQFGLLRVGQVKLGQPG